MITLIQSRSLVDFTFNFEIYSLVIEKAKLVNKAGLDDITMPVVEVGAELTGGLETPCIKIGYSSREPRRVPRPCIKIGYVSAMYKDMEPTQCIKIGDACIKIGS